MEPAAAKGRGGAGGFKLAGIFSFMRVAQKGTPGALPTRPRVWEELMPKLSLAAQFSAVPQSGQEIAKSIPHRRACPGSPLKVITITAGTGLQAPNAGIEPDRRLRSADSHSYSCFAVGPVPGGGRSAGGIR